MDDFATFKENPLTPQKLVRWAVVGVVVVVLLIAFVVFRRQGNLRIVNVYPDPSTSMAPLTPYLKVTFNKELSKNGLAVSSDSDLVQSSRIDKKTLTITLTAPNDAMDPNQSYKITIEHIESTDGKKLTGKTFSFSPKDVDAGTLPVEQQQAILRQTESPLISVADIDFSGVDDLFREDSDVRLQSSQGVEEALFHFAPFADTISVDKGSVSRTSPDSDDTTINFMMTIPGNQKFKAKLEHTTTTERLYVYDEKGQRIFDSNSIDLSQYNSGITRANPN